MKLLATTPDPNDVRQYYKDMAEGRLAKVDMEGFGRLGRVVKRRVLIGGRVEQPIVRLVTPTAMATERARAQVRKRRAPAQKNQSIKKKQNQPIKKKEKAPQKKGTKGGKLPKVRQSAARSRRDNFSK